MNTSRNLLKRLLRLFPAKLVKEYFEESGNSSDVIEIVTGGRSEQDIKAFVESNYLSTRQHIYMYELNSNFNHSHMNDFPFVLESNTHANNIYTYFFLPIITYQVTLYNPLNETTLQFLQPAIIKIENKTLTVHLTKIEKTISSYYPHDRGAVRRNVNNGEMENIDIICNFFNERFGLSTLDINTGIKYLWDNNSIDGKKVQWRKDSSVATETMDEDLLFKQRYPLEYNSLINQPLVKTLFKYIRDDQNLPDTFDADPSNGHISIPKFPNDTNQITNVIREILTHN